MYGHNQNQCVNAKTFSKWVPKNSAVGGQQEKGIPAKGEEIQKLENIGKGTENVVILQNDGKIEMQEEETENKKENKEVEREEKIMQKEGKTMQEEKAISPAGIGEKTNRQIYEGKMISPLKMQNM